MEYIEKLNDGYPCLKLRKLLLLIKAQITIYAESIVSTPLFEITTILVIIINSIVLASDNPKVEQTTELYVTFDTFFIVFYTVECGLKILAYGF